MQTKGINASGMTAPQFGGQAPQSLPAPRHAPGTCLMTTPVPRAPSLIDYPCTFPIKVMGAKVDGFVAAMTAIAIAFDPGFDAASIELRDSKAGNYLGITLTIHATSREQLDELYRTLSTHPMVRVVL
jgi:putative lipoic acid-binding regulatory protein